MNFVKKTSSVTRGRGMIEWQRAKRSYRCQLTPKLSVPSIPLQTCYLKLVRSARHFDRHKWKGITQTQ